MVYSLSTYPDQNSGSASVRRAPHLRRYRALEVPLYVRVASAGIGGQRNPDGGDRMMIEEAHLHRCRYGSYRSIAAMISFSSVILLLFVLAQLVCMAEATGAGDSDAQPGSVQQFEVGVHVR